MIRKIVSIACASMHIAIVFISFETRDIWLFILSFLLLIINAGIFTLLEQYHNENKVLQIQQRKLFEKISKIEAKV